LVKPLFRAKINDLNGVVPERGHEQALPTTIKCHVVNATAYAV
jgi:hypothetical protein